MPRKLRLEYAGAIYHVMNRGDRREKIFRGKQDREIFLRTLAEACEKTGWQVHAWCLNEQSFSPVYRNAPGESGGGDEVAAGGLYQAVQHPAPGICGHLFAGRYKALIVEDLSRKRSHHTVHSRAWSSVPFLTIHFAFPSTD